MGPHFLDLTVKYDSLPWAVERTHTTTGAARGDDEDFVMGTTGLIR